jgi:hypothetical protein
MPAPPPDANAPDASACLKQRIEACTQQHRALQAAIKAMVAVGMSDSCPAVAALSASSVILEQEMATLRAQRTAALPTATLAERAVRDRDAQMAKTKKTATMLSRTDLLIEKLQVRKLELTKQLAEQQAKSDRLAAEASALAAKVAAEALAPKPSPQPRPPPSEADDMEDAADDAAQKELDALDLFMSTEGTGTSRPLEGDDQPMAKKAPRKGHASTPSSP